MKCLWMEKVCKNERIRELLLVGILLVVAIVILIFGVVNSRKVAIASVDMEKIVNAHPAMQEAIITFQRELSNMQKQLDNMKEEEKVRQQQKIQQEISQIAMKLQDEAMDKVKKDVEKVAKSKGYTYVIDKNAIFVGGKDITDDILTVLKKQYEKEAEQKKLDVSEMPMIPVK
ncbi:MAG: OmpH family outer membrane protein [Candidatus Omnitrophica bacterium]|nr:OmpH family outer membrane protein [Candidatus Omnitrophota bacterium]